MSTVAADFDRNSPRKSLFRFGALQRNLKWLAPLACGLGIAGYGWQNQWFGGSTAANSSTFLTYEIQPRDLPITVIERGNLESQTNLPVYCEVDDVRSDGINGTPIVWVIANGSSVKKGDLICELDSAAIQVELDDQILDTEEARSTAIQAEANLKNQEIQNSTAEYKAELDVQLAELELEMYQDDLAGSHILAIAAINRQVEDLNNEILAAEMNKELRKNEKTGIESLFKLGYAGKSELDRVELSYLQAEGDYSAKLNKLRTQLASLEKLNTFDKKMQLLELQGKLETSLQARKQVSVTNSAKLIQMQGVLLSRNEQLRKEEERLKRYQEQYAKCKIYAPQDGMVAYATPSSSRDSEIAEGVPVRPRQHILSIPNLERMQVKANIHESVLDRTQVGQQVAITVDAFPDRRYSGTVKSVAVLPQRSYYSDTKTYETTIVIDEDVYQLKPGMTAVSEIKVDYLKQVNAVPVQAVVQRAGVNWLFVQEAGQVERRQVTLGASNDQYVMVSQGVDSGDQVVLNPASLMEGQEEDGGLEFTPADPQPQETLVATSDEVARVN
ncbi:efflux RND transporter periplasmic adaptor subunit [Aureliella helgolandensis]|uniref:Macrolide export protein MacA n=1 Tax=Aureliella helgolandensis TaxID=2527968 RepID=A0A518G2B6_9BACT|nr:efflux RND transporter periplasmic adaptor subunit [Aureliella helgolandensis]QDV22724.1 Macrolide export protein MacA [Aureliella helgolandensis]